MTFFANDPLFTDTYTNSVSWLLWIVLRRHAGIPVAHWLGCIEYKPRNGYSGSDGTPSFGCLEEAPYCFPDGQSSLQSHQQDTDPSPSQHPHQLFACLLMIVLLTEARWNLHVVFICIIPDWGSWSPGRKRACVCPCSLLLTVDVMRIPAASCSCHCHFPAVED